MTKNEALKLALEALELAHPRFGIATEKHKQVITTIKEALAQPEQKQTGIREIRVTETVKQKPVAWMCDPFGDDEYEFSEHQECENCVPCYATPPKRPWVGLTGKEKELIVSVSLDVHDAVHRTNAKLKELNT